MSSLESDVRIELIKDINSPYVKEVNDLADANKKTLGFCPYSFYQQKVKDPGILVAFFDEDLVGYLIWSINKNHTRLWQLCVKQEYKGKKIAKRLNDELVKMARPLSPEILLKCKGNYGIDEMWRALGYSSIFEKPAKTPGDTLTVWSMRFTNPNLPSIFSYIDSENSAFKCSIDAYTLQKFIKENPSGNSVEWLRSYLGVCITSEILNEIKTLYPERQEDLWSLVKSHFLQQDCENIDFQKYLESLKVILSEKEVKLNIVSIRHIARCLASKISYFITERNELLDLSSLFYEKNRFTNYFDRRCD